MAIRELTMKMTKFLPIRDLISNDFSLSLPCLFFLSSRPLLRMMEEKKVSSHKS